jgi:HK97 gp10 family phage protein
MKLTWTINESEIRAKIAQADRQMAIELRESVKNACDEGAQEARDTHQYKDRSGALTASIDSKLLVSGADVAMGEMTAKAPYASYVEGGTEPHVILPKNGQFLKFTIGGRTVFARKVNHPGTKPHPFMGPAFLKAERVLRRDLELGVQRLKKIIEG